MSHAARPTPEAAAEAALGDAIAASPFVAGSPQHYAYLRELCLAATRAFSAAIDLRHRARRPARTHAAMSHDAAEREG